MTVRRVGVGLAAMPVALSVRKLMTKMNHRGVRNCSVLMARVLAAQTPRSRGQFSGFTAVAPIKHNKCSCEKRCVCTRRSANRLNSSRTRLISLQQQNSEKPLRIT